MLSRYQSFTHDECITPSLGRFKKRKPQPNAIRYATIGRPVQSCRKIQSMIVSNPLGKPQHHKGLSVGQFQCFAQLAYPLICQSCHPETSVNYAFDGCECVFRACINQPEKTFDNHSCGTKSLEIYQRLTVTNTRHMSGLLCVVGQVMNVKAWDRLV